MNADLELARAVFPDQEWSPYEGHVYTEATFCFDGMFCPLGDHFADVLAWLLRQDIVNSVDSDSVVTSIGKWVSVTYSDPHNGTAASIKQAVYEAAIRVIKEATQCS